MSMQDIAQRIADVAAIEGWEGKLETSQVQSPDHSTMIDVFLGESWYRLTGTSAAADALFMALLGEGDYDDATGEYTVAEEGLTDSYGQFLSLRALAAGEEHLLTDTH